MIKDKQALEGGRISILGARVHNLKNIDVEIPRNKLTVITGMSGSGKSSLAFDTIFAEGQRRYVETFSAYARNFLGNMERPDVDKITGLSPVISIEQKTTNKNPRSTVGTTTEIYDFFRLLYARAGEAYSYLSGEKMVKYTEDQVLRLILDEYNGKKTYLLAPLVRNRKGHYKELFEQIRKKGYLNVRVDGELKEIFHGMKLDRYKMHSIEVVIDKMIVSEADERRLKESLKIAMKQGDGLVLILDAETNEVRHYSRRLMDPVTGLSYSEPAPHNFSFNSPQGACPKCKGLGQVNLLDMDKIVPDPSLSIYSGGIVALGKYKNSLIFWQIEALCQKHGVTIKTPIRDIPEEAMDEIMNGTDERLQIKNDSLGSSNYFLSYEGVAKYILMQQESEASASAQKWAGQFIKMATCPECNGWRLNKEALSYRIAGKNIAELSAMDISELYEWLEGIEEKLDPKQLRIATEILKEIRSRLRFLLDVGARGIQRHAQSLGHGSGDVAEAYPGSQGRGLDLLASRQDGDILSGVVGGGRIGRVAAVVGGDHHHVVLPKLLQQAGQPGVELGQGLGVAVNVPAVAVEHIKVHQIHEAQAVEILLGVVQGVGHAVGVGLVVDVFRGTLSGKNVENFAHGDGIQPGVLHSVQQSGLGRLQGEVVPVDRKSVV